MNNPDTLEFVRAAERAYLDLLGSARADKAGANEPGLGGLLLYAGELTPENRANVVAGNIAGAATLCATDEVAMQKMAVRESVVDFLVTSLDEALRILKNEIRKREAVAVCIGVTPEAIESEMVERGVAPDLLCGAMGTERAAALGAQARWVHVTDRSATRAQLAWRVAETPARWMSKLDALVLGCMESDADAERRWLKQAPRYLGRSATGVRVLSCALATGEKIVAEIRNALLRGDVGIPVEVELAYRGMTDAFRMTPGLPMEKLNRFRT